jgi:WXG100 family type VII secretion target
MTRLGMDDDAVRTLAGRLDEQAKTIAGLVGQVEGVLSRMHVSWRGQDADSFVGRWQNQLRPAMQRAQESISGLAQSARNNAAAQERTSAVVGAPGGVAGHAGAAAHVNSSSTSIGAGYAAAFKLATPAGTVLGNDGQCVQVFTDYNLNFVHGQPVGVGANHGAREFYERFDSLPALGRYYDKVPPTTLPQAGDVVVWGSQVGGGFGHIAVCTGSTGSSFEVVEQNNPEGAPVRDTTYTSMSNVIGYLRPKQPS